MKKLKILVLSFALLSPLAFGATEINYTKSLYRGITVNGSPTVIYEKNMAAEIRNNGIDECDADTDIIGGCPYSQNSFYLLTLGERINNVN